MGCRTFQYHRHTILMHPLQELLTSCQSQQSGLILSLASPRNRRRTQNGSGIAQSAAQASVRVRADGHSARVLARIVVRSLSAREGTVSDRIRHVPTRGRNLTFSTLYPTVSPSWLCRAPLSFWIFFVYSMYVCISLSHPSRPSFSFFFV